MVQNPRTNFSCWIEKSKLKIIKFMKLTNLYNYGSSKVKTISSYTTLDSDPVIWDSENVSDEFDKQFASAIYDCAKEISPYILIIELLELHEVSLEEINEKILQIQANYA